MAAGNFSLTPGQHPYYPLEVEIAGYLANKWGTLELLTMFTAGLAVIFSLTYAMVKRLRPNASTGDLATIMWFVMCGCIHSFFEGYFAYNFRAMGGRQDLFGQLWKEYSLSDSRYLTQDAFVLCMETVTAVFWGPGSFITAYLISIDHPLRYSAQLIVSLGQFYGDVLYYATSLFDHYILNVSYTRPEAAYYWGYFVLMNAFWIVIPGYLMYQSVSATWSAFAAVNDAHKLLQRAGQNGFAKKSR
ncbi:Emopamil-binding protein [Cucurbitaria berberidis CBS 394.84]|uniref:Emopamil-binding protein n=1 Tax=Cucurbitaria berberidis CBS 394.84 TaxID=1168544 RepID=A0A9P4GFE2_9PLEO|nr:Emopamil-binding protein [Cucurbitaria berberidis CBS 394.84]KAF1844471.1 Emopamil-binding protein [Cucurbitaria berberidis CBS 394.84]